MDRAVAYLRVSTQRQQRSGLGIDAQRAAIERFAAAEGLTIISEYTEAETGKGAEALDRRPAACCCPGCGADSEVLRSYVEAGPVFTRRRVRRRALGSAGADADPFMLHLFAALAERERLIFPRKVDRVKPLHLAPSRSG